MNCTCLKSLKLPLTAAFAIVAFSAQAADIYTPAAPAYAAVALPPSWGGFYAGINGGYGGNSGLAFREDVINPAASSPPAGIYSSLSGTDTIAGGFGGGQLGYNFQFGSFVAGFETDIQGSNIMGSGTQAVFNPAVPTAGVCEVLTASAGGTPNGVCAGKNDIDVQWFGTVRGRLGYAWGGTLLYATGGFAYGGVKSSTSYLDNLPASEVPNGLVARASKNTTQTGWAAGAGIETKLSPSWALKGEYQFVDLGSISTGLTPAFRADGTTTDAVLRGNNSRIEFNTVRVGLNYYFNAPPAPLPLK